MFTGIIVSSIVIISVIFWVGLFAAWGKAASHNETMKKGSLWFSPRRPRAPSLFILFMVSRY